MPKDTKRLRKELVDSLLNLLEESNNEVLDYSYETDDEWAFIECENEKGQQVLIVFNDSRLGVEVYVDGEQVKCGGGG